MLQTLERANSITTHEVYPAAKKRVIFCKKVSFDTFKDIIYIPSYNKKRMSHLWWSISELKQIQFQAQQEVNCIMKTSVINLDIKGALRMLCHQPNEF